VRLGVGERTSEAVAHLALDRVPWT
jgi:hypothetical protein